MEKIQFPITTTIAKSTSISILTPDAFKDISYLCSITSQCTEIALNVNYPADYWKIQKYLLYSKYIVLVYRNEILKGFACFSEYEINQVPALHLHMIVLDKDVQRKGICIKILLKMTDLFNTKYLSAKVPPYCALEDSFERLHQFFKVSAKIPYINALEDTSETLKPIVLKHK